MSNRLTAETSPYLRQHADNPVDWFPWGDEALTRAKTEDKPILLSIGYAACHWCHVMAHESFEDPATAAVMNAHFVNVKVDREERPDLDSIYMQAVQAMTGHGGWPMTVFLTPDGEPFYGGTYYPPTDRHGMPSFTRVLQAIADTYTNRRASITASATSVREIYQSAEAPARSGGPVTADQLELAYHRLAQQYDTTYGGFGGAPKFPPTMALDFLLRHWARTGTTRALDMARQTFHAMARGGIYDQIGGGFARYAVDGEWKVPHFEKMLYDNALLLRLGAHLVEATDDPEIRRITDETATWLLREMTAPSGGFYASYDADSEGHEGKFYVWDAAELDAVLDDDAPIIKRYFGVTATGNFEGKNILFVPTDIDTAAARFAIPAETLRASIAHARRALYDVRATRVWPMRDDKIIAAWNGLALRGIVDAARALGRQELAEAALANGAFLAGTMDRHGHLVRSHMDGNSKIAGFLDDHAAVGLGYLALFEQSIDTQWLVRARTIADVIAGQFWDDTAGAFFDTARDATPLITRPRDVTDNAIPSGTSLAVEFFMRLADYTDHEAYRERGRFALESLIGPATQHPAAFGHLLGVAEYTMTTTCHGDYCDMPSPRALDAARATST